MNLSKDLNEAMAQTKKRYKGKEFQAEGRDNTQAWKKQTTLRVWKAAIIPARDLQNDLGEKL